MSSSLILQPELHRRKFSQFLADNLEELLYIYNTILLPFCQANKITIDFNQFCVFASKYS